MLRDLLPGGAPPQLSPDQAAALAAADVPPHQENVTVPSLHVADWYDLFVQATIDKYTAAAQRRGAKLVVGPWNHVARTGMQGDIDFGIAGHGAVIDFSTSVLGLTFDWLRACLTTGGAPDDDLPVKIYVPGAGEWRSEPEWPLSRAIDTRFQFGADGTLAPDGEADPGTLTFTYDPRNPVPTVGGATVMPYPPSGSFDQRVAEERDDVLVFTTDVLTEDVEVTGRVTASLRAATDGPTTDWVVRLCDVHPDGRSYNVVDGITREGTSHPRAGDLQLLPAVGPQSEHRRRPAHG
ncbi:CocE/NonD family hydrolase [Streptomyces canus]|uniref:CocE/NonD family hydrolase n=1 Tax=Streptomyces canus TaxID=58343 RepID=UPI003410AAA1